MHDPSTETDPDDPIDPAVARIIRFKAQSLVGRTGLTPQDRPDLEQELALQLLEPLRRFEPDPEKGGRLSYVQTLVERFAANILRERRAAKRGGGTLAPLPEELPAPEDEERPDPTASVDAVLAALPHDLRAVAESLRTRTIAATARALGISRGTVYARLREIRGRTEVQKLGALLPRLLNTSRPDGEVK